MSGSSIKITFDPTKAIEGLKKKQAEGQKAISRTVSDMKSRAPGAVASAVTGTFRIKKSEITRSLKAQRDRRQRRPLSRSQARRSRTSPSYIRAAS